MDLITSRKNSYIVHLRKLASDSKYRRDNSEFICEGIKTLKEALYFNSEITSVLWKENDNSINEFPDITNVQYCVPEDLLKYASPLENSSGPVFTVKIRNNLPNKTEKVIILENIQDPGNVGTVLRSARAFGIDLVLLVGCCADIYNYKAVRASMGAVFSQAVMESDFPDVKEFLKERGIPLYGASLSNNSVPISTVSFEKCAVAVGNEGRGLSRELILECDKEIIIPMSPDSESLNAAVAASILMWEMFKA